MVSLLRPILFGPPCRILEVFIMASLGQIVQFFKHFILSCGILVYQKVLPLESSRDLMVGSRALMVAVTVYILTYKDWGQFRPADKDGPGSFAWAGIQAKVLPRTTAYFSSSSYPRSKKLRITLDG